MSYSTVYIRHTCPSHSTFIFMYSLILILKYPGAIVPHVFIFLVRSFMFEISTCPSPTICLFLSLLYLISSVRYTLYNWPTFVLVIQNFEGFLLFFSDFSYRPGQKQHCLHRRRSLPGPKGTVQISLSVLTLSRDGQTYFRINLTIRTFQNIQ